MNRSVLSNKPFLFILFTAFLSIMGIGLIIPVVPFIVQRYIGSTNINAIAFNVGLLTSLYALCQFFAAPVLGALSDKYGRKPLLLLCLLGSTLGYMLFGIGGSLWILFLSRIIDGITGGDISIAMAYVADVTKPHERGKYYGIIGATIGLGFMIGPTVGGLLSYINLSAPLFFAAGLTLLNMLFGYFILPETVPTYPKADFSLHHLNPFRQLNEVIKQIHIRTLIIVGMYYYLPFSIMSGIMSVYYKDTLHWSPENIGLIFLILGIGDMFTQGFLSGKLLPKFGELKLVIGGFFLTGFAFATIAFLPLFPIATLVIVYIIIYALGSGLFEPSFSALASNSAQPQEQGRVQGAIQSMESIMRIIGPLLAAYTYQYAHNLPYIVAAIVSAGGIFYTLRSKAKITLPK